MLTALLASAAIISAVAAAPLAPEVRTRVIRTLDGTLAGQPIRLPAGPVRVTISEMTLPAGARLPPHRHPFARHVHVLAGRLAVKDLSTGSVMELGPDDWAVDIVDAWHEGQVLGDETVRLLLIEQAPPGAATTVLRDRCSDSGACSADARPARPAKSGLHRRSLPRRPPPAR